MNEAITTTSSNAAALPVPVPRCGMSVRAATAVDIPFIDALQKMHSHMVGWMPTKQIEGKIGLGHIIIAEDDAKERVGYCIGNDQYFKRDDVGIIYQLNVLPMKQRSLIGATLIKAMFERAAYGCRLFCCWCAQDIQANHFWESIGFVPLAFRTGSRSKQRIHIFWQRRIRENDTTTPWWFPSQTQAGAIREDRLVFPIPPGTHWRDTKPIVLPALSSTLRLRPEGSGVEGQGLPDARAPQEPLRLPGGALVRPRPEQPKESIAKKMAVVRSQSKHLKGLPAGKATVITSSGLRYVDRADYVPEPEPVLEKPKRERTPVAKNDPKLIAFTRELRDRWLERVNDGEYLLEAHSKYEVSR